jgi:hypothetical protein
VFPSTAIFNFEALRVEALEFIDTSSIQVRKILGSVGSTEVECLLCLGIYWSILV